MNRVVVADGACRPFTLNLRHQPQSCIVVSDALRGKSILTAEKDAEKPTKSPAKQGVIDSVNMLDLLKEDSPAKPNTAKTLLPGLTIDATPPVVASSPHKSDANMASQQSAETTYVPGDKFQSQRPDSISIFKTDIKDPKAPTVCNLISQRIAKKLAKKSAKQFTKITAGLLLVFAGMLLGLGPRL